MLGIFKTRSLGRTTVALFRSTVSSVIRYFSLDVADRCGEVLISQVERRQGGGGELSRIREIVRGKRGDVLL